MGTIINGLLAEGNVMVSVISFVLVIVFGIFSYMRTKKINAELANHKRQHAIDIENMKVEFLRYEAYTTISKEIYQNLFSKRIVVYETLLSLKNEIDQLKVDNVEFLEMHEDSDSLLFANAVKKISVASKENYIVISNDLAVLSSDLVKKSNKVFSDTNLEMLKAEMQNDDLNNIIEAENKALQKMFSECYDVYKNWFIQLDKDVSKIRKVLDFSGDFLKNEKTLP